MDNIQPIPMNGSGDVAGTVFFAVVAFVGAAVIGNFIEPARRTEKRKRARRKARRNKK